MEIKSTILEVIEELKDSEDIAVISGQETLSYRELVQRSQHIGRALVRDGIRKGECIMLTMSRNVNAVCAIFGMFYAGAVFVATDSRWPEERMEFVRNDTNSVLQLDDACFRRLLESEPEETPLPVVTEDDVAAIIFTSGSTGVPKGVVLHHKVLQVYVELDKVEDDSCLAAKTCLCVANFAYVVALLEIALAFHYGKTLLLSTDEELANPVLLAESMNRYEVDFFPITPSVALRLFELPFFKKPFSRLKSLPLTGEIVTPQAAEKLAGAIGGTLWIHYGSTEAGECASFYWRKGEEIRLGHRANGVHIYLLDEYGEEVLPGEEGEIYISGPSADCGGYLHHPELTKERFPVHPKFGRLFRTGDYGRRTEDGDISPIGRKDGMIKLNGQRIEVEEVEAAIEVFPGITRAAVCVQKNGKSEALCAFYTADKKIDEKALRKHLSKRLPMYMIPAFLNVLDAIPENASGKRDRKRLPCIQFPNIKNRPRVSVLTPVHETNLSLLERAAASVMAQSFGTEQIEWVIGVHNMSEAYFKEVEEKFGEMENVFIFSLNEPTETLGAIRNALLERAQGTYLFWLDSDDELTPECISRVVKVMEEHDADMAMFPFREEAEEGAWYVSRKANFRETETCVYEKNDPSIGSLFAGGGIDIWCWGYRTEFLKKSGLCFDTATRRSFCDGIFLIEAVAMAERVAVLPGEEGYVYHIYAGSDLQSRANGEKAYEACLSIIHVLEETKKTEQKKMLDLNNWRWTVLTLMLSFFTSPLVKKGKKEEIREKLKPWVESLRAIDASLVFSGRPEKNGADLLCALFPEEVQKHAVPVYRHIRTADLAFTDPENLTGVLKERMKAEAYHLVPDENNLLKATFQKELFPEISFVDLTKADSALKKEERIRSYIRLEELRGFQKHEVPLRITQFLTEETKSEILITWDARYFSEMTAAWLRPDML